VTVGSPWVLELALCVCVSDSRGVTGLYSTKQFSESLSERKLINFSIMYFTLNKFVLSFYISVFYWENISYFQNICITSTFFYEIKCVRAKI